MHITNKTKKYPCTGYYPTAKSAVLSGIEGLTLPISGAVTLCADDGFVLTELDVGSYARQTYTDGVLTLTNEPEPVPEPAPKPQPQPPNAADVAEALIDMDTRVSMLEMGVK